MIPAFDGRCYDADFLFAEPVKGINGLGNLPVKGGKVLGGEVFFTPDGGGRFFLLGPCLKMSGMASSGYSRSFYL